MHESPSKPQQSALPARSRSHQTPTAAPTCPCWRPKGRHPHLRTWCETELETLDPVECHSCTMRCPLQCNATICISMHCDLHCDMHCQRLVARSSTAQTQRPERDRHAVPAHLCLMANSSRLFLKITIWDFICSSFVCCTCSPNTLY